LGAINLFLTMRWPGGGQAAKIQSFSVVREAFVSPEQIESFLALALGFAFAGLIATGYQYLTERPASFHLLKNGPAPSAFAAVPFLVFAAPFIIMRNTLRARRLLGRRLEFVMLATVLAGFWSMMSGTVVIMTLHALGLFGA
jgi:hypothetical protein